ncbi:hypothetical protein DL771_008601 [Monosporascus sp. 5C6A]|nr:hypothetical protein DL771_008601 [Monosporascus sp. 5C6A]
MATSDSHPGNAIANNSAVTTALGRPRQQGHRGLQPLDHVSRPPYSPSAGASVSAASPTTTNNTHASHAPLIPSYNQQHQHQESGHNHNEKLAGVPLSSGVVTVEISSPGAAPPPSAPFEFRGFDFFSKRDFNELREASRAYFNGLSNSGNSGSSNAVGGAPRNRTSLRNSVFGGRHNSNNNSGNAPTPGSLPSAWLGDETPPATPRTEDDGTVIGGDGRAGAATAAGGLGGGSGARGGAAAKEGGGRFPTAAGGESHPPPPPQPEQQQSPQNEPRILGLRKKMLWVLLVLIGIVLVVVVIAVGVGVGLGNRDSRLAGSSAVAGGSDSDSSGADDSTATTIGTDGRPAITATVTMTTAPSAPPTKSHPSSSSSPKPTVTDSPDMGGARLDCPAANGTTYQVPGSIKRFLRVCGVDYRTGHGQGFATEVGQVQTETMLDCMKNCAGTWGCEACGWGYLEGDGPDPLHTCFMKSDLRPGARREVDDGWSFALLL